MGSKWLCGVLVVAACSRANPDFIDGLVDTSSAGTADLTTDMSSGTVDPTATTTTTSSSTTSSTSSPTEPTTDPTATTDLTATTEPTTTTTDTGATTVDPTDTGTTGEPSEQELCDAAAVDPNAVPLADFHAECGSTVAWGFALAPGDPLDPTICGVTDPKVGLIVKQPMIPTSQGATFTNALKIGPWTGTWGLVQGSFNGLDLAPADLPCLVTRIAYPVGAPPIPLKAQVVIATEGLEDLLIDLTISEKALETVVLPIPSEYRGLKVDLHIITLKQDAPDPSSIALAWERPRIVDGAL